MVLYIFYFKTFDADYCSIEDIGKSDCTQYQPEKSIWKSVGDKRESGIPERCTENGERQKTTDSTHQYAKQRAEHKYGFGNGKQHYSYSQPANALANPEGAAAGDDEAISQLIEGLMLGGFAMQWSKSSRPASGAEHQFSHLWNMEHHLNNGEHISHGFQVSIGMLAVTAFYEQVLRTPLENLDVEACCAAWPTPEELEKTALEMFVGTDFPNIGVQETKAKYVTREELAVQLQQLKEYWPKIRERLLAQLLPYKEVKRRLELVGAPTEPEQIGITRKRLRDTFIRAQFIRRRLAVRSGYMKQWLDGLFGKGKIWEITE